MNSMLRELMEQWLCQFNGGTYHPNDEKRFYDFVLASVESGICVEQTEYESIIDASKDRNANLTDSYLEKHNFNQFESYCEFCKYILRK